jgi:hypothetical protein
MWREEHAGENKRCMITSSMFTCGRAVEQVRLNECAGKRCCQGTKSREGALALKKCSRGYNIQKKMDRSQFMVVDVDARAQRCPISLKFVTTRVRLAVSRQQQG